MRIPPETKLMERFDQFDAEVHSLRVSTDRSVLVYDANYPARVGDVPNIPALFAMMCVSGGGALVQRTARQDLDTIVEPGDIGIAAPSSPGTGQWPEMRVIGFGIHVSALADSFGKHWPRRLKREVLSKPLRDPMVEATMMQVGYTHAGRVSDSVLLHAAHMVVHQLLDTSAETESEGEKGEVSPLPGSAVEAVHAYVIDHIDLTISVDELARHLGISRHHFSRRFRQSTGQSPYQFILDLKLDEAAKRMQRDRGLRVIDVANMVGYQNAAQFSQAFRRRFGKTPRLWRVGAD
ncbi:MAG: AraC family transcriptional regulator [Pseudomonadota bacterium]